MSLATVRLDAIYVAEQATGNTVRGNTMVANQGLAINLLGGTEDAGGQTANDNQDADSGPNDLQNYPTINSAKVVGNKTTVTVHFNSVPNADAKSPFIIDLYATGTDHVTTWAGQVLVPKTNSAGDAVVGRFTGDLPIDLAGNLSGKLIAVTATHYTAAGGSTSEFSPAVLAAP